MAQQGWPPGKQRTRAHVIADQSVNHVERYIIDEGHRAERLSSDYGYDLALYTHDPDGYTEPGLALLQLKASESLSESAGHYVFDLDVRDCRLWLLETMPVILVLYDASGRRACWLHVQGYFRRDEARLPRRRTKTIRVKVPRRQPFTRKAVAVIRELKQQIARRSLELIHGEDYLRPAR
jgi:Domain of unknown function (DUF4365)